MHVSKDLMWRGIWKILQNFLGTKLVRSTLGAATFVLQLIATTRYYKYIYNIYYSLLQRILNFYVDEDEQAGNIRCLYIYNAAIILYPSKLGIWRNNGWDIPRRRRCICLACFIVFCFCFHGTITRVVDECVLKLTEAPCAPIHTYINLCSRPERVYLRLSTSPSLTA
jgi:hypothetical protein